jgi:ribosomal protein S6
MEKEGREPQVYEVGYHLIPSLSPEKVGETVSALQALIRNEGGSIIAEESPKSLRLAYTMVKHVAGKNYKYDTAHFGWIKFEVAPTASAVIKDALRIDERYLRYILIKTVRESTLYGQRLAVNRVAAAAKVADAERRADAKKEVTGPVSEEEVDKAIDELVIE